MHLQHFATACFTLLCGSQQPNWSFFVCLKLKVLATGLSALYSSLPRKIEVRGDDWHALRREDWIGVSSLVLFMNSLEFCNAVVQVAHPLVRSQLLDYLHNGFLVPVMGPALHKVGNKYMLQQDDGYCGYRVLSLLTVNYCILENNPQGCVLQFEHKLSAWLNTIEHMWDFFVLWVNWSFKPKQNEVDDKFCTRWKLITHLWLHNNLL